MFTDGLHCHQCLQGTGTRSTNQVFDRDWRPTDRIGSNIDVLVDDREANNHHKQHQHGKCFGQGVVYGDTRWWFWLFFGPIDSRRDGRGEIKDSIPSNAGDLLSFVTTMNLRGAVSFLISKI